jgi:hypothetical protein
MKAPEAAEYLCFKSVEALYQAIGPQRIPVCRRGSRTLLFHRGQLDAWLAGERRQGPTPVLKRAAR